MTKSPLAQVAQLVLQSESPEREEPPSSQSEPVDDEATLSQLSWAEEASEPVPQAEEAPEAPRAMRCGRFTSNSYDFLCIPYTFYILYTYNACIDVYVGPRMDTVPSPKPSSCILTPPSCPIGTGRHMPDKAGIPSRTLWSIRLSTLKPA